MKIVVDIPKRVRIVRSMSDGNRHRKQRRKPKKASDSINPNEIKVRDPAMLAIINGATKAGVHKDRKKESDKYRAREKVRSEEE